MDVRAGPARRLERQAPAGEAAGFATKGMAAAALEEANNRAGDGSTGVAECGPVAIPEVPQVTVAEYVEGWLEEVPPMLAVTAWVNYRTVLRIYVLSSVGSWLLRDVTEDDLSGLHRDLLTRGGPGRNTSPPCWNELVARGTAPGTLRHRGS